MKTNRFFFSFSLVLSLFACNPQVEEPKNLLSEEQMATLIADFAIYEQAPIVKDGQPLLDMDGIGRAVLKSHQVASQQFLDSYRYYISRPGDMEDIYDRADEILLEKDPKLSPLQIPAEGGSPQSPVSR